MREKCICVEPYECFGVYVQKDDMLSFSTFNGMFDVYLKDGSKLMCMESKIFEKHFSKQADFITNNDIIDNIFKI